MFSGVVVGEKEKGGQSSAEPMVDWRFGLEGCPTDGGQQRRRGEPRGGGVNGVGEDRAAAAEDWKVKRCQRRGG
jgi:hypothetical protein